MIEDSVNVVVLYLEDREVIFRKFLRKDSDFMIFYLDKLLFKDKDNR